MSNDFSAKLPLPYCQLLKIFELFFVFSLPFVLAPHLAGWTPVVSLFDLRHGSNAFYHAQVELTSRALFYFERVHAALTARLGCLQVARCR